MSHHVLDPSELQAAVEGLDGWTIEDGKLTRTFEFDDFVGAFGWMTKVALHAEKANHHPEWFNVYRTVRVQLQTHDAGPAITDKDIALARVMNDA